MGKWWKDKSTRRKEQWKKFYEAQREMHNELRKYALDILSSPNFQETKEHIQHGSMTVNNHSINVAKYSLAISKKLGIACNQREMVRGALLHDYFLYDWHDKDHVRLYKLHGFRHPGVALNNAVKEYRLTERERDIIKKHMWPLTIVPPMCREAWIVSAADKYCSFMETVGMHKGHGKRYACVSVKAKTDGGRV